MMTDDIIKKQTKVVESQTFSGSNGRKIRHNAIFL